MLFLADQPDARLRDLASGLGVTERTAFGVVADLSEAGYVVKERDGRRNRCHIQRDLPLRDDIGRERSVGELLDLLASRCRREPFDVVGRDRPGAHPRPIRWPSISLGESPQLVRTGRLPPSIRACPRRLLDGSPSASHSRRQGSSTTVGQSVGSAADLLKPMRRGGRTARVRRLRGDDCDEVVEILGCLRVPSTVIAQTVLSEPTAPQRSVRVEVAALVDRVVFMSGTARVGYATASTSSLRQRLHPQGAAVTQPRVSAPTSRGRPCSPGGGRPRQGIELVIVGIPHLQRLSARPGYRVVGPTYPKWVAAEVEAHRSARIEQAWRNGVAASVEFDADYRYTDA